MNEYVCFFGRRVLEKCRLVVDVKEKKNFDSGASYLVFFVVDVVVGTVAMRFRISFVLP